MNEEGKIKRNLIDPIRKDTVAVPDAGFTVMRFKADNPGFWLLHCHMSWHNHVGMAVVLQVNTIPGFGCCIVIFMSMVVVSV